jgi:hypothetical protein
MKDKNKKGNKILPFAINYLLNAITTSRWVIIVINYSDQAHHAYQKDHFLPFSHNAERTAPLAKSSGWRLYG